jgi:hypothetical protein
LKISLLAGLSLPELVTLSFLLLLVSFVTLAAAYPYLKKAQQQAGIIKHWEQTSASLLEKEGLKEQESNLPR